jgi:Kef-type K+ transport system membrane component KefB
MMQQHSIVFSIFLIFFGAAVLATIALYLRQAMLIAYLALGAILGPWGLKLVTDANLIQDIARIGIIFLLFLLGLNLSPRKLLLLLRETTLVTVFCSLVFSSAAGFVAWLFGFGLTDILIIGLAASFSSTIIGLKLLPTTVLHHRHTGEVIISVLLLQDLIAIVAMLVLQGVGKHDLPLADIALLLVALPGVCAAAWFGQKWLLLPLYLRFDRIQEYVFLLTIGWCLGIAQLSESLGLSYEIGAFIAGITIASSPVALYIAESLKPLRDFFLVMFFFGLGAGFDIGAAGDVLLPAAIIGCGLLLLKPLVFRFALVNQSESNKLAWETGIRLGQLSEFSLLIVFVATNHQLISEGASTLVQIATLVSFIVSAWYIVLKYPTPIALNEDLRRD